MIPLKSNQDLAMLRRAGEILAMIMQEAQKAIKPGITTKEIDLLVEELVEREKVSAAFKGYKGFPASICTSINEEIVHGIPGQRTLKEGDIIGLDIGINHEGYFADAAITLGVGKIDAQSRKLIETTKTALQEGIRRARVGNRLGDISYAIQRYTENKGFSVVRQFVGHGIGRELHEEPEIPNFGAAHQGPLLKNGMVLAIEPMVNMGTWEAIIIDNGWTAITKDGQYSAHFEHTVAITDNGAEILTN